MLNLVVFETEELCELTESTEQEMWHNPIGLSVQ